MENAQWLPHIDRETCIGCGDCVRCCPTGVLGQQDDKAALLSPELCIYCADCEALCPVSAIEIPYLIVKQER